MQVSEVITLSYKGGPQISLPASLIQYDENDRKWLKFRPSSHTLTKLVLGHMENFKKAKNPSLAASPKVKMIQDKVKEAVLAFQEKDGDNAPEMFAEAGEETSEKSHKEMKIALDSAPASVTITLLGHDIEVKTPASWKQSDLLVPIEANCLTVLRDYILQDVSGCLDKDKKRQYVQSGRFKKKGKVFGDKADDD